MAISGHTYDALLKTISENEQLIRIKDEELYDMTKKLNHLQNAIDSGFLNNSIKNFAFFALFDNIKGSNDITWLDVTKIVEQIAHETVNAVQVLIKEEEK